MANILLQDLRLELLVLFLVAGLLQMLEELALRRTRGLPRGMIPALLERLLRFRSCSCDICVAHVSLSLLWFDLLLLLLQENLLGCLRRTLDRRDPLTGDVPPHASLLTRDILVDEHLSLSLPDSRPVVQVLL